jgi:tight adherence protein C
MSGPVFPWIVAAAAMLGMLGIGLVIFMAVSSRAAGRLQERLSGIPAAGEFGDLPPDRAILARIASGGKALEALVDAQGEGGRLMVQAGWRTPEARLTFYAFQALCPVIALLGVAASWVLAGEKTQGLLMLLYAIGALIVSILVPRWVLRRKAAARRARIKSEVPLFIHLLVLLFEAGLSTRQAIASLVREGRGVLPELGRECDLILRQLEAGGDTAEVLKRMAEVLEVADLTAVLGVLRQVDRYGGEVREPLLEALKMIEERRGLDLREKVNLVSGRMTVVMVLFFFPALIIFVAGPAFLSIIRALAEVNAG